MVKLIQRMSISDPLNCTSVGLHATKHFQNTGHTVMVALPNKQWKWCYIHKQYS
ncbi:MAG: UBP-type zinc finger domain-containing protein [Nitrososphaeraceae archaeon]|nr:UBP-type zinc finger domain-containing protein [Nitrososphaeraceae archaeon]